MNEWKNEKKKKMNEWMKKKIVNLWLRFTGPKQTSVSRNSERVFSVTQANANLKFSNKRSGQSEIYYIGQDWVQFI